MLKFPKGGGGWGITSLPPPHWQWLLFNWVSYVQGLNTKGREGWEGGGGWSTTYQGENNGMAAI